MFTIGALLGTLESYLLQCCDGASFLKRITICDLDAADYNSRRDNGSLCYRNIYADRLRERPGDFTFIRGNSAWPDVRHVVRGTVGERWGGGTVGGNAVWGGTVGGNGGDTARYRNVRQRQMRLL